MTLDLQIKNNYLLATDVVGNNVYDGLAKDVRINKLYAAVPDGQEQKYSFENVRRLSQDANVFLLSELTNNGTPWADADEFENWYTENTGKSSGGASPFTSDQTAAIQSANSPDADNPFATIADVVSTVPYKASFTSDGSSPQNFTIPANTYVLGIRNRTDNTPAFGLDEWTQSVGTNLTLTATTTDGDIIDVIGETYASVSPVVDKQYILYVGGQGNTGFLNTEVKKNTTGIDFVFERTDVGTFSVTGYDPFLMVMFFGSGYPNKLAAFSNDENSLVTINGDVETGSRSDLAFGDGGFFIYINIP